MGAGRPDGSCAGLSGSLAAAEAEGGDVRGMQSAAILIRGGSTGRLLDLSTEPLVFDLRVDEHQDPVTEPGRLIQLRRADLVSRAGDKTLAAGDRQASLPRALVRGASACP